MEQKNEQLIPCLPESAPFTAEQRAYLNGFLAGIFSRAPAPVGVVGPVAPAETLAPLSILFGSQTGNSEILAKRIAKEAGKRGFAPTIHDLARYPTAQLASEQRILIVTSTYGDGEPPDNAKAFWNFLNDPAAPKLAQTRFSICALGDSNYPKFCGFGKDVDLRLESLGAQRIHPCTDCDVDYEEPFAKWLNEALTKIGARESKIETRAQENTEVLNPAVESRSSTADLLPTSKYSRANPFPAALVANKPLNAPGSSKDTRHFEFALDGSGLTYEAGDALAVSPANCPELAEDITAALKCSGNEMVPGRGGIQITLREALLRHYEITKISPPLLAAIAERSGDETLKKLVGPDANGSLAAFLYGREVIDLLLTHPSVKFDPVEFVTLLKKLQPRLYSISSSPKAHPARVHLTVNIVRFESHARRRKGVCSTYLAERAEPAVTIPVFVHANKNFRPPADGETPMIMVGPGTGIAPFRAFLQERRAMGASGKNWLFYGDQHSATDFMYRDELEAMLRDGVLTRLDTAFSRDQEEKVYVQHRMREHAKELFNWLEAGAHFYVCGDAKRMAKDVDAALHEVIQTGGGHTAEQAVDYISCLKNQRRYQRDVY
jgi:sulfite reductase (NADPH) flavoprotein alpha-component